ncbi:CdaR family transcriptional regulator [Neobacillus citreus]|uniref:Helix-turn-helix domain-containing protein n=1 Tax=Neobacillus citreus TaxID=2833578 RepID=A0A942T5B9_9BACI|nr:sugar diacid recognition domain-containing protein [Neobacillus citreus]MCH6268017.1 helix-turn-helix domain-containing protein [Neobacillus citreus]
MLTQEMAAEIVKQTMIRLNRNINIMDHTGTIIASGDQSRIHQLHSGALEVLRTGKPLFIKEDDPQQWEGSLPGINLPITFQDMIIGVIGITGKPEEIMEFGALVKMITEMMIHQSFIAEQFEWKQRLKEQVFEELLKDQYDVESINQRLNLIEIKLTPSFQIAIIEVSQTPLKKRELLQILENSFDEGSSLVGFLNSSRIFLLTSQLPESKLIQKLKTVLNSTNLFLKIGIGSTAMDFTQIHHSFQEAQQALLFGGKDQALTTFAEIEPQALLAGLDERAKRQYLNRVIGNLSDKLIETLDYFFKSNQNIGECAKRMYIHRNSLIYRLKKIKEVTGLDPQVLNDAVTLQLAVWLLQMNRKEN